MPNLGTAFPCPLVPVIPHKQHQDLPCHAMRCATPESSSLCCSLFVLLHRAEHRTLRSSCYEAGRSKKGRLDLRRLFHMPGTPLDRILANHSQSQSYYGQFPAALLFQPTARTPSTAIVHHYTPSFVLNFLIHQQLPVLLSRVGCSHPRLVTVSNQFKPLRNSTCYCPPCS